MVSVGIGAILLGATLGIHIEGVKGVPKKKLGAILKRLKKDFEKQTGGTVKFDRRVGPCVKKVRCIERVRARTKGRKLLFLKLIKGNSKANKLIATIVFENGKKKKIGVKIPNKRKIWPKLFPRLVSKLLKYKPKTTAVAAAPPRVLSAGSQAPPRVLSAGSQAPPRVLSAGSEAPPPPVLGAGSKAPPPPVLSAGSQAPPPPGVLSAGSEAPPPPGVLSAGSEAPPPPVLGAAADGRAPALPSVGGGPPEPNVVASSAEESSFAWAAWVTVGGSLLAGGAGVYFGLESLKARTTALSGSHEVSEIGNLNKDVFANGIAANVLLGSAVLGLSTSVVLFILD